MHNKKFIEVIEFTDPACTWCWGSEPALRKLETLYEGNIEVNFIMGGLVKDIRDFRDNLNDIGGDISSVNAQVASHWIEASERHGMPVEPKGFNLFTEENPSTYPMNIAYKAAQFQSEELAKKFLRRIRMAVECEARQANKTEVLIELAGECGLDIGKFIKSLNDGTAEKAFYEDLEATRAYRVQGFPSFLVKGSNGKEIMLRGYQSFDTFKAVIDEITNGELTPKNIEKTEENIINFIKKLEHVAVFEIATAFDLSKTELEKILESLDKQKLINIVQKGNGYFVTPSASPLACNPDTGMCNI
jgi:predicted DsbA family dithiol-disulfide isomerase